MSSDPENNPYMPPASDPVAPEVRGGGSAGGKPDLRLKDPRTWGWAAISFIWLNCLTLSLRGIEVPHPAWLSFLALAVALTWLVAIVSYLVWFFQVAANAKIISPNTGPSPGWAVGCHFIPFLNWVLPAMFMKEINDASFRPRAPKGTGYVVAVWWAAFILRNLILTFQPGSIFGIILGWVAAIGAAWLIIRLTLRQVDLRESGLPASPKPAMLPLGGPRPVAGTRVTQPASSGIPGPGPGPVSRPRAPSRPGTPAEVRVVSESQEP